MPSNHPGSFRLVVAVLHDPVGWSDRCDVAGVIGGSLADFAVGPLGVVVLDVFLEQPSELGFVPDDGPVQEFVAQRAHPSFGVRVCLRRARWNSDGCDAGPGEDVVVRVGELSGPVSDQESEPMTVAESHHQVSGCLGGPRAGRVRGDTDQVDASGGVFDDE